MVAPPVLDLDAQADALLAPPKPPPGPLPATWLPNGFFTLTFPDGSHKTFRIRTERQGKLIGRRTLGLLIGPQNTDEYESFAFVTEDWFEVWKRYRGGPNNPTKHEKYADLIWGIASGLFNLDGHELAISKRCMRCNRVLTTPESLKTGYGPECSARRAR